MDAVFGEGETDETMRDDGCVRRARRFVLSRGDGGGIHAFNEEGVGLVDQDDDVLHALLWIVDRKPFFTVLVSAGAQFAYSQMLRRFPFIVFTSAEFLTLPRRSGRRTGCG